MRESPHRSIQASREQVEAVAKMSRSMNAHKATRISPSAMAEVQSALNDYWDALDASDLSEASKGIYMANADNFVRWMRDDFTPGSRNTPWKPARATYDPESICTAKNTKA
jgi:hypothetical protein